MTNCSPVWNINLAETSNEVIERVERALELGGKKPVKLEVLDKQHKVTINREVIKSVEFLRNKIEDLEIWPLIYPDETDFIELCKFNCRIIRLMGSPISSKKGVENGLFSTIINIINMKGRPAVMLDGGIGKWEDIDKALDIGFDKFLVNSCLFDSKNKPDESLLNIKQKLENKIKTNKKI
jgi:thiazole synthase ThiGH ThiG subunit